MKRFAIIHKPSDKLVGLTSYGIELVDNENGILTYISEQDAEDGFDNLKEEYCPEHQDTLSHALGGNAQLE